jgi:glutaconate CoA-transferase subunit A
VTAVAPVPGGAAPSYAHHYSVRDNAAYAAWDGISRDRETVLRWMQDRVLDLVPSTP